MTINESVVEDRNIKDSKILDDIKVSNVDFRSRVGIDVDIVHTNTIEHIRAFPDVEEGKLRVYRARRFFGRELARKVTGVIYGFSLDDIFLDRGKPKIFCDFRGRESINLRKVLNPEYNKSAKVALEAITEKEMFQPPERKMSISERIIWFVAGGGLFYIITSALRARGVLI